jgi:hypothetical protein
VRRRIRRLLTRPGGSAHHRLGSDLNHREGGGCTAFYAHLYPGARIIAIDLDRANFEQLRRNCACFGNVTAIHGALWHKPGAVRIANPRAGEWGYRAEDADDAEVHQAPAT